MKTFEVTETIKQIIKADNKENIDKNNNIVNTFFMLKVFKKITFYLF